MGSVVRGDAPAMSIESIEESGVTGGSSGRGSDVALVHLAKAVTSVSPLPIGNVRGNDIGQSFTAIGYGLDDNLEVGTRRSGTILLKATTGKVLPPLISLSDYESRGGTEAQYNTLTLLDAYEVVTGPNRSGTQPGPGDSGGPLLREQAGRLEVVGVTSYAVATSRDVRSYIGTVYAIFGPDTQSMIEGAIR